MTMKNKDKFINKILEGFQHNKGKSSFYCFNKDIISELVYKVIYNFNKKNDSQIFIVVDCYETRCKILKCLDNNDINRDDIKIISKDYIKLNYHYPYKLIIIIGINDDIEIIQHLNKESKFTMLILTKNIMDSNFINSVRNILLDIDVAEFHNKLNEDFIYSPVEEHRLNVVLSNKDRELYNKYTEYINTSVSIFGDLSNIEKCKYGDSKLNVSAAEYRNIIAKENGWREDLDTTIPFIRQIDDIYNPNNLQDRACNFYNIAKQRKDLVTDNANKLDKILEIVKDNKDKKILIISKRGEYAKQITNYINKNYDNICGDYHDCIDDIIALDINGFPILVKSGENKGKPRILGSQAQSTLNEKRFNNNLINVLSIKCASNNKLKIACDLIIFTSPFCEDIISIRKRFINVKYNNIPTRIYKIYCKNTIENEKLNKEKSNNIIKVTDDTENFIGYDEISGDIIL